VGDKRFVSVTMAMSSYVLVTPARNEVGTIGRTIQAVVRQTIQPSEWVIVSDGSTDGTNEVILSAAKEYSWIRLLALPPRPASSFAAVVRNTETGIRALVDDDYAYLGLLDADLDFQADYFEELIRRFEVSPQLGLIGGVVIDHGTAMKLPRNRVDVPGAVQLFRRACFEGLGGLLPIPEGGWDCLTCAVARMNGFETQLCVDLVVDHLKPRNISQGGPFRRALQMGTRDYAIGYAPLFEFAKCVSRVSDRPLVLASLASWVGYCMAALKRRQRIVPPEVVLFLRREQYQRLWLAR
jgi:poly-beta-1,6-N-acetyl-D-glucosamine synthase